MRLNPLNRLTRVIADPDVAIDLGTANTRLFAMGRGLIADQPSEISLRHNPHQPGHGVNAGATSNEKRFVMPLRRGVVADIDAAAHLLEPLVWRARRFGLVRPRALTCTPSDVSNEEREALIESALRAGVTAVTVVPEPLAAAIGAGLDIVSPYAQMLIDMGDGVTDIAIVSSGTLLTTAAVRTACSDLHTAIRNHVAKRHGVLLYQPEAQRLTHELGAVRGVKLKASTVAQGRWSANGHETSVCVSSLEVAEAIDPIVEIILETIRQTLRDLTPKVATEVIESGICLTGGGARLRGLAKLIAAETSLEVRTAADPLHSVIRGAGQMLAVGHKTGLWHR